MEMKTKTSGGVKIVEVPPNFECGVSQKFIDEMYGLLKVGADGKKEIGKIAKRLRKMELGFEHQELKKMRAAHYESALMETGSMAKATICQGVVSKARFRTGQSAHHFWASWFKNAEEPKVQLKEKARPSWYSAFVLAALGERKVKYAGQEFHEQVYQVH